MIENEKELELWRDHTRCKYGEFLAEKKWGSTLEELCAWWNLTLGKGESTWIARFSIETCKKTVKAMKEWDE